MHAPRLVLASGSPRRRELLTAAGFHFEIDAADIDETIDDSETPADATSRLALGKAEAVAARRAAHAQREVVLAADTTVVVGTRILGKPANQKEAVEMLLSLAGRNHDVLTAWAVLETGAKGGSPQCGIVRSTVRMREIARAQAQAYAASGEPMDKAGAYAAQGEGRRFIGAIVGPLDNVIGLPMAQVVAALARAGIVPVA
jgi:septum formation protein